MAGHYNVSIARKDYLMLQRIDFNKLDTLALKRYRRIHKLDDVGPNPTKEELVSAVSRHFTAQVCWVRSSVKGIVFDSHPLRDCQVCTLAAIFQTANNDTALQAVSVCLHDPKQAWLTQPLVLLVTCPQCQHMEHVEAICQNTLWNSYAPWTSLLDVGMFSSPVFACAGCG